MTRVVFGVCLVFGSLAWAQEKPSFEAASIKKNTSGSGAFSFNIEDSGRVTFRNMTLWVLLNTAWGWRDGEMTGGPAWIKSEGFDIQAVPATGSGKVERSRVKEMLQTLITDRFQFRWHEETREESGYALKIAAGGPKLAPPREGQQRGQMGNLSMPSITLDGLCQIFEFELGRLVADQTGLNGSYAIDLQWAHDNDPDTSRPSLVTAVQEQLGLRLESAKLPVKMHVIDSAEHPAEN